jgi:hypothetical protein
VSPEHSAGCGINASCCPPCLAAFLSAANKGHQHRHQASLSERPGNGAGLPGSRYLLQLRADQNSQSGDWTAIYRDIGIDARGCSALVLNMDVKLIGHNLEAGG